MVELSSLQKLCEHLISSAIRRCRVSEDLCRISVVLKSSSSNPPTARIAISDTGTGSRLDEFQGLKLTQDCATRDTWEKKTLIGKRVLRISKVVSASELRPDEYCFMNSSCSCRWNDFFSHNYKDFRHL